MTKDVVLRERTGVWASVVVRKVTFKHRQSEPAPRNINRFARLVGVCPVPPRLTSSRALHVF